MALLLMIAACNQDDNTQATTPIEPIIFSDVEVGQKFFYQRYVVNNCDSLPGSFEWRDDTLVLEVTGLEESKIFLQESLTEYSENYYENTPPVQYSLDFTDGGLLSVGSSYLFSPYSEDTLRLHTSNDNTVEQNGCHLLHDSSESVIGAFISTFELGDISLMDKSVSSKGEFLTSYDLFYDSEKIYTLHTVFFDDVGPFNVSAFGWNLIEE